uniref:Uncharacterized protein n=1 Tax=Candidatus Kentrum sp. SD TaxID=2126332 RepID=A0A450YZK9_9GAMM|nr:MAG: hypothetical protein BECKSD772F_GA0070984_13411 [Candidatus Kentron sp. SD]VFK49928.1 MAG: hypothetical protein BECKSD772E_GA0070983_12892 [Candidatus Kentron sp. SD]
MALTMVASRLMFRNRQWGFALGEDGSNADLASGSTGALGLVSGFMHSLGAESRNLGECHVPLSATATATVLGCIIALS